MTADIRVLHVTESLGGGVASAVQSYVAATPELEHHLIAATRAGELSRVPTAFTSIRIAKSQLDLAITLSQAVNAISPDVVHAHSSFAGAIARRKGGGWPSMPSVYSPHCFAFRRTDLPKPATIAIRLIEERLARRTSVLAACSPGEARLAREIGHSNVVYVPNTGSIGYSPRPSRVAGNIVATIGRISLQKDPVFFAQFAEVLQRFTGARLVWIGDGDPALKRKLEAANVRVTGWLPPEDVAAFLAGTDVYVHTAAWEGFPIAVLDAISARLPIVVRNIDAFIELPDSVKAASPSDLAQEVALLLRNETVREHNYRSWQDLGLGHTVNSQRTALLDTYSMALNGRVSP